MFRPRNPDSVDTQKGSTSPVVSREPANRLSVPLFQSNSAALQDNSLTNGLLLVKIIEAKNLDLPGHIKDPTKLGAFCIIEHDKNEAQIASNANVSVMAYDGTQSSTDKFGVQFQQRVHFDTSRENVVNIAIYIPKGGIAGEDLLIGSARVNPVFQDQKASDEWLQLTSPYLSGTTAGSAEVRVQTSFNKSNKSKPLCMEDFELLKVLGKGSFGKVMQVRKKTTSRIYAMKIIKKAHIVERDEITHTLAERNVLAKLQHPFIIPLKFSFQSPDKLYLVLAFVNGGELFFHLQNEGKFSEERSKFYAAELLTALDCLHSHGIVYRDLKNILLDYTGHIALCDFGLAKLGLGDGAKTATFCGMAYLLPYLQQGTPEYLSPEIILGNAYTKSVDWWTLGILLYEMLTGLPPFYDQNTNDMYNKIVSADLIFPSNMSTKAKDILRALLTRDPEKRLGANGADEIKRDPFFSDINWNILLAKKYQTPFKPNVQNAQDTSNFDEAFTSETPVDSVAESSAISALAQDQFEGFSYAGNEMGSMSGSMIDKMARMNVTSSRPLMKKL